MAVAAPSQSQSQTPCPNATLPAYAHNDYENARPLVDAISQGFRGIEVDVFLVDGLLRVGHDRRTARAGHTLESLYFAPLKALAERCDAFASLDRPFFVAIEIKETSEPTFSALVALLNRYRELLFVSPTATARHAPIEVVLVGWHPATANSNTMSSAARGTAHDIALGMQYRITHADDIVPDVLDAQVRLVSVDYGKTIGRWWVTRGARQRWLATLSATKQRAPNRLLRVHNVPVDAGVYRMLRNAGVDLIGTKELQLTAKLLDNNPI